MWMTARPTGLGLGIVKAYISLDELAVRDANGSRMKKQSQCKIWQAGNNEEY
jgi:hypothetical protein